MARRKFWIKDALKKPGSLRARLKELRLVKGDEPIPARVLQRAAKGEFGPKTQKRAVLARTLRSFHRKR